MSDALIIDGDALPHVPAHAWSLHEHRRIGSLLWNPDRVALRSVAEGGSVNGSEILHGLRGLIPLNACVLDALLEHQYLIPPSWRFDAFGRRRDIGFWGTQYSCGGGVYTFFLMWCDTHWDVAGKLVTAPIWYATDHVALLS